MSHRDDLRQLASEILPNLALLLEARVAHADALLAGDARQNDAVRCARLANENAATAQNNIAQNRSDVELLASSVARVCLSSTK